MEAINKNLDAEITAGEIDFSVLKNFPYVSINFSDVISKEPNRLHTNDTLLRVKRLSLLFNLTDVFNKKYNLKKIIVENGQLAIRINKEGENNYKIWKSDTMDSQSNFRMELETVKMKNMEVSYKSVRAKQDYLFRINDGWLSAEFNNDKIFITSTVNVFVEKLLSEGVNFVKMKEAKVELVLQVDNATNRYYFENTIVRIAGLQLTVSGNIVSSDDFSDYNLMVKAKDADLKSLLSVIPDEYSKRLDEYTFSGKTIFDLTIKGKSDKKQNPVYTINFGTDNTTITPKAANVVLKNVRFSGYYTSKKSNKTPVSYLRLKNVQASLFGRKISGNLEIENLGNPLLHFEANASADLHHLSSFFKPDTLEYIKGNIEIRQAVFTGKVNDITTYVSSGKIQVTNATLKFKAKPTVINNVEGNLELNKNNLKVNLFSGNTKRSDFTFSGMLENFFGYAFVKNQKLNMLVNLQSGKLDLNEILEKDPAATTNDTIYKIRFADDLNFTMHIVAGKLHFNKFNTTSLNGTIKLNNEALTTEALKFNTMEGSVLLQGAIRETVGDSLMIQYDASVKNLDITELFYQMGNFGQEMITDKNLKGRVTADIQFVSKWSNTLHCNLDKVFAISNITIENGELLNFSPMLALSKYVKGADLNAIKFATLKNTVEIKNRKVFIPSMEINSSVLNITANGVHGFDNMIDYHLQLLLSQILGKKVKGMNTEFGTIEDDNAGRTKLYISMKGPAANPKFSYDTKGLKEKISTDAKKERETLKEILKKEFGRKDSLPDKKEEKKQEELEIDTSEEE